MKSRNRLAAIKNQLRQFLLPFLLFIVIWVIGLIIFFIIETNKNFWHVFLISICVNESTSTFYNFYQFLWPLLFELLILTFVLTTLQEVYGFNPIFSSRKIASSRSNHTVVLGYNHLGERIVEHLRTNKQSYSLVELEYDKVEDLINFNQPVVVGDYTDIDIITIAGVKKCKEVICVTSDLRRALIAAVKIRELNKTCCLYMRVFNDHFREYLTSEPWNAFTFSTSKWTMDSVRKWSNKVIQGDKIIVLGNDSVVTRIVEYYGEILQTNVYLIDPDIDPEVYKDLENVLPFQEKVQFIENLEERCNMDEIKQLYLCWNNEEQFSDGIILTVAIKKKYPHIKLLVRMFDEELADIAKTLDATTFSTSAFAFKMLQQEVKPNSGIYPGYIAKKNK